MMDLDKIKNRVMSLLAKAGDPAASESEALACMTKAHKLMEQHGLSAADCEKAEGDDFVERGWAAKMSPKHGAIFHPVERLCGSIIAKFCGCRLLYSRAGNMGAVYAEFFGLEPDVAMAEWMLAALKKQFDRDWENYLYLERKNKSLKSVPKARIGFSEGFASAINERMNDWLYRSKAELEGHDNALVHRKQDLIEAEFARRGLTIKSRQYAGPAVTDGLAAGAGFNSGQSAQWSTGVYHGSPQLAIADKRR